MSTRVLSPATIIPQHLYIERAADRQLNTVVDDMGRPAYILVSRQMGKTNLLINMKRTRVQDLVVYFDLSNRFDSARKLFRYVIDSIVESNAELLDGVMDQIYRQRAMHSLEANVEYDRHLRLILKKCGKRLVIVLDEIDSLIGCAYSDAVLAQIRSMYFSRINYAEYDNLTYVLSGVAEPSELIKDKNISPFNIGEKIYLEDFTREEFFRFVSQANLPVSDEVVDRVFWWADGNPRISWDICLQIETELQSVKNFLTQHVDEIVDKLYLRNFDRAPVDHIRTLVESDPSIRNAVMSIRYDRSDFADDKIKGKLYLAGITKPMSDGSLKIKNRVIEAALSERWIQQLESADKSVLVRAGEAYAAGLYSDSIKYYEQALSEEEFAESLSDLKRMELGLAYLWCDDYKKAVEQFSMVAKNTHDAKLQQLAFMQCGTAFMASKDYPNSVDSLLEASVGIDPGIALNAKLNLQVAYLKSKTADTLMQALSHSLDLLESLPDENNDADNVAYVTALANLAEIYRQNGSFGKAWETISLALKYAPLDYKPYLLIRKFSFASSEEARREAVNCFCSLVVESKIDLAGISDSALGLTKAVLASGLAAVSDISTDDKFKQILNVLRERYFLVSATPISVLLELSESIADDEPDNRHKLLEKCARLFLSPDAPVPERLKLYRELASESDRPNYNFWVVEYLSTLYEKCPAELVEKPDLDAAAFIMLKFFTSASKEFPLLMTYWNKFEERALNVSFDESVMVIFAKMHYERARNNTEAAVIHANRFLALVSERESKDGILVFADGFKTAARDLLQTVEGSRYSSFGRNDKIYVKYGDAEPTLVKYKHVADDLKNKKCIFIGKYQNVDAGG